MFRKRNGAAQKRLKRKASESDDETTPSTTPTPTSEPPRKKRETGGLKFAAEVKKTHYQDRPDVVSSSLAAEMEQRRTEREDREEATFVEAKVGAKGPKAPSKYSRRNVKVVSDFKPGICKPYYQNGYCRWGDTCKYAHITEAYMNEADLDADWEKRQARGGADSDSDDSSSDEGDGLTCAICSERYNDPVVTRYCRHVFCGDCATTHDAKAGKCYICTRPTNGIFNLAKAVAQQLRLIEQAEEKARKREEAGVSSEDDVSEASTL